MQKECYLGEGLGAIYQRTHTDFRLWAPSADEVKLRLYEHGDGDCLLEEIPMKPDVQGTWFVSKTGDLNKVYYTYQVTRKETTVETQDPYSIAVGVNGMRSMVVDRRTTDPIGFITDHGPKVKSKTDLVVCEVSIADITGDVTSGVKHPGKYLGLAELGTRNSSGQATGLDYLKELGITHVQLMPSFDFASIDESAQGQYNWGYDPLNFNVPEGSYSTDPFHGEVRIREFKEMVATLHRAGIGVIMDVVYNHMFNAEDSCFEKAEPDYFFRKDGDRYSDASACGNETASEHPMVHKYIVDSVCYWAKEYHIDGFRFDLMGVLDVDTLNDLSKKLKKINPSIILYGEGWTGGDSILPAYQRAMKTNVRMLDGIGMFSDDIRDTIRGHVFYDQECGFVNGHPGMENAVRYSVTGAVWHPQVDYAAYMYTQGGPWAESPQDTVSYISCHDNLTLWDKLAISRPDCSKEERFSMNRLAAAMVFTSQGMPFFLSGEEFARTKPIEGSDEVSDNSYNLPLFTNAIRYKWTAEQESLIQYYKGLIAFRKKHEGLRLPTAELVRKSIHFIENLPDNIVAFTIAGEEQLFVVYNANEQEVQIALPDGRTWEAYIDGTHAGTEVLWKATDLVKVDAVSCVVLTASSC
ncbi:MAG: type I pullulanase [Lachnospiraceae bacterium]|nr:type I pullulanase [Lachnospiraceae bacterium]